MDGRGWKINGRLINLRLFSRGWGGWEYGHWGWNDGWKMGGEGFSMDGVKVENWGLPSEVRDTTNRHLIAL